MCIYAEDGQLVGGRRIARKKIQDRMRAEIGCFAHMDMEL